MIDTPDWIIDLQKEGSVLEVYKASLKLPRSNFNRLCRYLVGATSTLFLVFYITAYGDNNILLEVIKFLSDTIILIGVTILAFLAAGFTIFTTISEKNILIELAKTPQIKTDFSTFKYLFFNIMSVFSVYIFSISCAVLVRSIYIFQLPTPFGETKLNSYSPENVIDCCIIILLSVFLTEMILKLKSFVWNIYSTFVSMLIASDVIPPHGGKG